MIATPAESIEIMPSSQAAEAGPTLSSKSKKTLINASWLCLCTTPLHVLFMSRELLVEDGWAECFKLRGVWDAARVTATNSSLQRAVTVVNTL